MAKVVVVRSLKCNRPQFVVLISTLLSSVANYSELSIDKLSVVTSLLTAFDLGFEASQSYCWSLYRELWPCLRCPRRQQTIKDLQVA